MEESPLESPAPPEEVVAGLQPAATFLRALFAETDTILFRPIETWVDAGKKVSRVDYRNTRYRNADPRVLQTTLLLLVKLAAREHVNLFFGVCPRFGASGRFDLAWQIRTVRTLWADIDHVTVEDAQKRVAEAALPQPSITVNSGNGVHLYWLLSAPYLIDDAGDPLPVETEWSETPDGKKKPRKYLVENGDKVYLDQRRHLSRLSAKAEHIQDVLAGIAKAIGGDHATDLSRLLRIPGSLNRKDERNGREPVPTALVECDPTRRYPLSIFEPLATPAPETERAKRIAAMPLPRPRKTSASKADKLDELVATSAIAPAGSRSEADFAVCCFAVRQGIDKEDVWAKVEQVGKFAEQGRRYFDHTWDNAEYDTRAATLEKLQREAQPKGQKNAPDADPSGGDGSDDLGDDPTDNAGGGAGRSTIFVDPASTPVAATLGQVTDRLLAAGNCYLRADQLVLINQQRIWPILAAPELAGLLNQLVEFYYVDDEGGEYKPFTASYANTWLHNHFQRQQLPVIKMYTNNPVYADDWRLVAPGFDAQSGIYYAGPAVGPRSGTEHLDALLNDFCFKAPSDRSNYLGMLLTALLVPRFIGSKPAVLFNGNQPELGKSILAQIVAILRDGHPVETATYNPNDEEFEKRLGSIVRRGATTVIVDNAKARGRNPRIDSACLERSITDPILSYRLLGFSQDIRAENSHIFAITANSPDVSRDLVTRSVVVNLHYEGNPQRRIFSIADPEGYAQEHRIELLGELIGMVERWKSSGMPKAAMHTRFNKRGWGNIVGGILDACGEPDFLANADEAATQLDDTRREFTELVWVLADHPQGTWTAADLVDQCGKHSLLAEELGEGSIRSKATRLGVLAGRYVAERFELVDGRTATFVRSEERNGNVYRVGITEKVRNV